MYHYKLGRRKDHREAMLRNLVTSLLKEGKITTTETRGKSAKAVAEKLITLAKNDTLHNRRQALAYLFEEDVVRKLFKEIGPKYADRPGGYTRIVKIGPRRGDGSMMVLVELI